MLKTAGIRIGLQLEVRIEITGVVCSATIPVEAGILCDREGLTLVAFGPATVHGRKRRFFVILSKKKEV